MFDFPFIDLGRLHVERGTLKVLRELAVRAVNVAVGL